MDLPAPQSIDIRLFLPALPIAMLRTCRLIERYGYEKGCALCGSPLNVKIAVPETDPFPYPEDTEGFRTMDILFGDPFAVVAYPEGEGILCALHSDDHLCRS